MKKSLSIIALSTIFATSAFAQEAQPAVEKVKPAFEAQKHEIKEHHRGEHGERKKMTDEEKKAWREKHQQKALEAVDTNKDGKVSREEALSYAGKKFDNMDQNKDGFLTKEELKNYKYNHENRDRKEKDEYKKDYQK